MEVLQEVTFVVHITVIERLSSFWEIHESHDVREKREYSSDRFWKQDRSSFILDELSAAIFKCMT